MYFWHLSLTILAVCTVSALAKTKKFNIEAVAHISSLDGRVKGQVTFAQTACRKKVNVSINIGGLNPKKKHSFHVHDKGDVAHGCSSMGGYFQPHNMYNGCPSEHCGDVGDLGTIEADANGYIYITFEDELISLTGINNIIGYGLVIREMMDCFEETTDCDSEETGIHEMTETGNAGRRVVCGIIGVRLNSLPDDALCCPPAPCQEQLTAYESYDKPQTQIIYPEFSSGYPNLFLN